MTGCSYQGYRSHYHDDQHLVREQPIQIVVTIVRKDAQL